jgi:hypothetical protein
MVSCTLNLLLNCYSFIVLCIFIQTVLCDKIWLISRNLTLGTGIIIVVINSWKREIVFQVFLSIQFKLLFILISFSRHVFIWNFIIIYFWILIISTSIFFYMQFLLFHFKLLKVKIKKDSKVYWKKSFFNRSMRLLLIVFKSYMVLVISYILYFNIFIKLLMLILMSMMTFICWFIVVYPCIL